MTSLPHYDNPEFYALAETISDIVYRIDVDGKFTYLNSAIRTLKYEPQELIGKHFSELILPADVANVSREKVLREYVGKIPGKTPKLFDERRSAERKTAGQEIRLVAKGKNIVHPGVIESIGSDYIIAEINSSGVYQTNSGNNSRVFIGTIGVIKDITDRKSMEAELRKYSEHLEDLVKTRSNELVKVNEELQASERNFRNSLDDSPLGIFIMTMGGQVSYANRAILAMWGYSDIKELLAVPLAHRYTMLSYAEHRERMVKRQRGEQVPSAYEIDIVRKDGEVRHLKVFRKELFWNGEKQYQVVYEDISEQKWAQELIQKNRAILTGIIESYDAPIFSLDYAYYYTSFNQAHSSFMKSNYGRDIELGKKFLDYVPVESDRRAIKLDLDRALTGEHVTVETITGKEQSSRRYYEVSYLPVKHGTQIAGVSVFTRDITERKQAEEKLTENEAKYRAIFTEALDGIIILDAETGLIIDCNNEFARIIGRTTDELQHNKIWEVQAAETAGIVSALFPPPRGKMLPDTFESSFIRPDGIPVAVWITRKLIRLGDKSYIQAIVRGLADQNKLR